MPLLLDDVSTLIGRTLRAVVGPVQSEVVTVRRDLEALREAVRVLEARPVEPGPAGPEGPAGPAGAAGAPGVDGKPGTFADSYRDTFTAGTIYLRGDIVTDGGALWICKEASTGDRPGRTRAWRLIVKSGGRR